MVNPGDGATAPVETKVTVAGIASAGTSFVMGLILTHTDWFDGVAGPLTALVLAGITGALTFGAAWQAKHTRRSDADAMKGRRA